LPKNLPKFGLAGLSRSTKKGPGRPRVACLFPCGYRSLRPLRSAETRSQQEVPVNRPASFRLVAMPEALVVWRRPMHSQIKCGTQQGTNPTGGALMVWM
jgi:hypothetical protein